MDASSVSIPPTSGMVGASCRSSARLMPPARIARSAVPSVGRMPFASMKPVPAPLRSSRRFCTTTPASVFASRASGTASVQCTSRRRRSMSRSSTPVGVRPSSSRMPLARRSVLASLRRSMPNEAASGARFASSATARKVCFPSARRSPFRLTFPVQMLGPFCRRASNASCSAAYVCQRSPLPRPLTATSGKRSVPPTQPLACSEPATSGSNAPGGGSSAARTPRLGASTVKRSTSGAGDVSPSAPDASRRAPRTARVRVWMRRIPSPAVIRTVPVWMATPPMVDPGAASKATRPEKVSGVVPRPSTSIVPVSRVSGRVAIPGRAERSSPWMRPLTAYVGTVPGAK
jgi:hypothetical protein